MGLLRPTSTTCYPCDNTPLPLRGTSPLRGGIAAASGKNFLFQALLVQILLQVQNSLSVALQAQAHEGLDAGHPGVGHLAEVLPLGHIGDVDLHGGQGDRLQGVQDGHAGVGIGGGVDDDAVLLPISLLDLVHNGPLVVGLEDLHVDALLGAGVLHQLHQGGVVGLAVEVGLPNAQHVQVGAVNH